MAAFKTLRVSVSWRDLLPDAVNTLLGHSVDFLEIEGQAPISACSADWSWHFVGSDGALCPRAPVHYDPTNHWGCKKWGPGARGAIVVAQRGMDSFDNIARRAAQAGAVALVIVNDREIDRSIEMKLESAGVAGFYLETPPKVPAVLVPMSAQDELMSERRGMRARIMRR